MNPAPIILFVYNRPSHTAMTLQALSNNVLADRSVLYIYSDGPRAGASAEEIKSIMDVRRVIREKQWCKEVIIIERSHNAGLANAVRKGVGEVLDKNESVIVLEDDLVTSKGFLSYMNECLITYRDSANVWSVTGHMFPLNYGQVKSALLPYISTWGWATWSGRWKDFEKAKTQDTSTILKSQALSALFNLADYDYTAILKSNYQSSWGIQWYFHVFINHGLSVYPTRSMVRNIGMDGTGTHYKEAVAGEFEELVSEVKVSKSATIDIEFWAAYLAFFSKKKSMRYQILKNVFPGTR
jgi:hypothetical protein